MGWTVFFRDYGSSRKDCALDRIHGVDFAGSVGLPLSSVGHCRPMKCSFRLSRDTYTWEWPNGESRVLKSMIQASLCVFACILWLLLDAWPSKFSAAGASIYQGIRCPRGTDFDFPKPLCMRMICWQLPADLRDKAKALGDFGMVSEAHHRTDSVPFFFALPTPLPWPLSPQAGKADRGICPHTADRGLAKPCEWGVCRGSLP